MLIAIANAKGGVAKTTTAIYLAQAATLHGEHAMVLDADSQSSASTWADVAEQEGTALPFPVVAANLSTVDRVGRQEPYDRATWRFIDCPPNGLMLEKACHAADYVIIPSGESSLDLSQAWLTYDAVRKHTPAAVLIVKAELHTIMHRQTLEALDAAGTRRFETVVGKRQDIIRNHGQQPSKLYEYAQVYVELRKELDV